MKRLGKKSIPIGGWIVMICMGVAIERLTMILLLTQASIPIKIIGGLLFLTVPFLAVILGIRAYHRSRTHQSHHDLS